MAYGNNGDGDAVGVTVAIAMAGTTAVYNNYSNNVGVWHW